MIKKNFSQHRPAALPDPICVSRIPHCVAIISPLDLANTATRVIHHIHWSAALYVIMLLLLTYRNTTTSRQASLSHNQSSLGSCFWYLSNQKLKRETVTLSTLKSWHNLTTKLNSRQFTLLMLHSSPMSELTHIPWFTHTTLSLYLRSTFTWLGVRAHICDILQRAKHPILNIPVMNHRC